MSRLRPDSATALLNALGARLGGARYRVEALNCRDWASATFAGTRHELILSLARGEADAFLEGIEEAEFGLPGHILADLALLSREADGDETRVVLEALTVEDD